MKFIKIVEEEVDTRETASLVAGTTMAAPQKSTVPLLHHFSVVNPHAGHILQVAVRQLAV